MHLTKAVHVAEQVLLESFVSKDDIFKDEFAGDFLQDRCIRFFLNVRRQVYDLKHTLETYYRGGKFDGGVRQPLQCAV